MIHDLIRNRPLTTEEQEATQFSMTINEDGERWHVYLDRIGPNDIAWTARSEHPFGAKRQRYTARGLLEMNPWRVNIQFLGRDVAGEFVEYRLHNWDAHADAQTRAEDMLHVAWDTYGVDPLYTRLQALHTDYCRKRLWNHELVKVTEGIELLLQVSGDVLGILYDRSAFVYNTGNIANDLAKVVVAVSAGDEAERVMHEWFGRFVDFDALDAEIRAELRAVTLAFATELQDQTKVWTIGSDGAPPIRNVLRELRSERLFGTKR